MPISEQVLAALADASIQELEESRQDLIASISEIDGQLAGQGRIDGGEYRLPLQEFHDWRRRAVSAKLAKTRELIAVKAELSRRTRPQSQSEGGFWREHGRRFLTALEELENVKDLSDEGLSIVRSALDFYADAVQERQRSAGARP